jgi:hypothetical protein
VGTGTIVPGTTDTGNHIDDGTTTITLPFAYQLYNQTFTAANISSNGNIQFVSNSNLLTNACPLPSATFNMPIMPHWDDLRTDQVGTQPHLQHRVENGLLWSQYDAGQF